MKKILFLYLTFIIGLNSVFGQEECSELKNELEKQKQIVVTQEQKISELQKEIAYYKEALNLRNSKLTVEQDDFVLKINSAKGNIDNGIIIISGIVENNGIKRTLRTSEFRTFIYDSKGNNYKAVEINFGNLKYLQEFQKSLPMAFTMKFDKIGEEMPMISNLTVVFTNHTGKRYEDFVLKNIPVDWK